MKFISKNFWSKLNQIIIKLFEKHEYTNYTQRVRNSQKILMNSKSLIRIKNGRLLEIRLKLKYNINIINDERESKYG